MNKQIHKNISATIHKVVHKLVLFNISSFFKNFPKYHHFLWIIIVFQVYLHQITKSQRLSLYFMSTTKNHPFSDRVITFQEKRLPEQAVLAGYAAIIKTYKLRVPLPITLTAIGKHHVSYSKDGWNIKTPKHQPAPTLIAQLTFALKYEGIDLAVLKQLFLTTGAAPIEALINGSPTGSYARRIWFLYEWLLGTKLDLPDIQRSSYVLALDEKQQFGAKGVNSPRHRVRNNLPGTPDFCPLVFKTKKLVRFIEKDLEAKAKTVISKIPKGVMARTAAFLLLKDSKSSYAIEGESPPQDRIQRWGRAIGQAGKQSLDIEEFLRLQNIVIGDQRFIQMGIRDDSGFIGEHERDTGYPLPVHISARHEDLNSLMQGLIAFDQGASKQLDAVLSAAVLSFGFVYIHPFFDGNGRIHRYLIHHVLSQNGFNPVGVTFPVSAAILERIDDYIVILESYSKRCLPYIDWKARKDGNVEVLNDTLDFYRYFDATPQAEFLYACVEKTIEEDLPNEAAYLQKYDNFKNQVDSFLDMSDRQVDLLFRFMRQNNGKLSKRALKKEFASLTAKEVSALEEIFAEQISSSKN